MTHDRPTWHGQLDGTCEHGYLLDQVCPSCSGAQLRMMEVAPRLVDAIRKVMRQGMSAELNNELRHLLYDATGKFYTIHGEPM